MCRPETQIAKSWQSDTEVILNDIHHLLQIGDGSLEIRQLTEAFEATQLGKTQIAKVYFQACLIVDREIDFSVQVGDGGFEIRQCANMLEVNLFGDQHQ